MCASKAVVCSSKLNLQNCENIDGILLDPMLWWPVAKSSNNLVHLFNSREIFRKTKMMLLEMHESNLQFVTSVLLSEVVRIS